MLSFTLSRIISSSLRLARPFNIHQQHSIRLFSTIDPSNESTSPTASSMSTSSNNRETGTVKRFSKEKGYGFISKNSDGTDCFVHFKNITGAGFKTLEEGQQVEFDIVQGDKGVEARDVNVIDDGTGRLPPFNFSGSSRKKSSFLFNTNSPSGTSSSSSPFNFGGSSNRNPSSLDSSDETTTFGGRMTTSRKPFNFATSSSTDKTFSSRSSSSSSSEREMGSVKRWTSERGFGFIRRASGGADLFCHVRSLKNGLQTLEEGQTVQFRVQLTDRGEEARDVSILTEETIKGQQERPQTTSDTNSTAAAGSSTRETGVVRRWLPEKSYGFVRRSSGGSDVFVHMSSLTDGIMSLEEGQTVEFDVESTTKGDIARNVTVHNES